ncbi:MAG: L-lysine 6-transaminase [Ignavibacteriales bacterium]|nr:L-lysine 6-transaminase [Ignavibacteriales bacterium]
MTEITSTFAPGEIHETLSKYMLADGMDMELLMEKSQGAKLHDLRTGKTYIDFFSFFASQALGVNHPKLSSPEFKEKLAAASINKPSNSDVYTPYMAEFVDTFGKLAKPEPFKYLFFVEGGGLAVENALKTAFDWKVRKNLKNGVSGEKGSKIIHFKQAFHGRTGYTMSLTNTDVNKVQYFPKFDWPRIENPKITFPLEDNLAEVEKLEKQAEEQIRKAVADNPNDVAGLIIEPIQGEGGDNMFRKEFFQKLRELADELDFLLIFDEVQTGLGLTGKLWAHEYYVTPDIVAFGKKTQVCGIMSTDRVDEVEDNVFHKSSRLNSTWGGNLTDMVRSAKVIQTIHEENLVENAKTVGEHLGGKIEELQSEYPSFVSNARGLGLWRSFDCPTPDDRDAFVSMAYENGLAILGCGEKTVRFRPALIVDNATIDEGMEIVKKTVSSLAK